MTYNETFLGNATSFLQIAEGVNDASNGLLFIGIIVAAWVIMIITFQAEDSVKVMFGSSFLIAIASGLLAALELMPGWFLAFPIVVLVSSILLMIWRT